MSLELALMVPWRKQKRCANPDQEMNPHTSRHIKSFYKLKATAQSTILLSMPMFSKTLLLYFYGIDNTLLQKSSEIYLFIYYHVKILSAKAIGLHGLQIYCFFPSRT